MSPPRDEDLTPTVDGRTVVAGGGVPPQKVGNYLLRRKLGEGAMSPETEEGRYSNNETLHRVTLSKPFMMATTVVTQGQWKLLMGDNPRISGGDDNLPVHFVMWEEAVDFCRKLNEKE